MKNRVIQTSSALSTSTLVLAALVLAATIGCDSTDERLVSMATESARRQAQQSREMVQLQQEVAAGTRQLVSAEAESRQTWLAVQQQLGRDGSEIHRQRDVLESERRAIAAQRNRDPIVAAALESFGWLLACLVPLCIAWYALRATARQPNDDAAASAAALADIKGVATGLTLPVFRAL